MSLRKKGSVKRRSTSAKGLSVTARNEVASMLKEGNADLLGSIKTLLAEKPATKQKKVATKVAKKSVVNDPMLDVMKGMKESIDAMNKSNRRSRRKALAEEEDQKNSGVPAKVLKDATDPATVKFALYACAHNDVHKSLSDDERSLVNAVYIQCMDASTTGA